MPISIDTPGSPGWLFWYLAGEQRKRRDRLDQLWERYEGNPPLPEAAETARDVFRKFQRKARTNFAELVVQAGLDRATLLGFRTSEEQALGGTTDLLAGSIWDDSDMPVEAGDILEFLSVMGEGYSIVGPPDRPGANPVITAEDPRDVITLHDPARPSRVLAALKLQYDEEDGYTRAYIYTLGEPDEEGGRGLAEVWVARRTATGNVLGKAIRFAPQGWDWEPDTPSVLPIDEVPVTRYRARRGLGVFETHVDILDRINHMILQRMVIATMQAFRQRAIKGLPLTDPKTGKDIDYAEIFTADPGAIWAIPATAEMWESGQVDLSPILNSVRDDVRDLAALTRTPLSYFVPDAANGSAEGASLTREGLVFRVEDLIQRAGAGHRRTMALALRYLGRDDLAASVTPLWAPVERFSLAQRYDAALKSVAAGVPWRTRMLSILQFTPAEVERMEAERLADELLRPLPPAPIEQAPRPAQQQ